MRLPPRWSWSKLNLYRNCPLAVKFKYIDLIPEPERSKEDKGAERGTRVHEAMEHYFVDNAPLPPEASKFETQAEALRDLAPVCEVPVYFNSNWQLCDEENHWLIVIKDANVNILGEFSLVIDFKTGKRFGNEATHMGQKTLYAISNWIVNPDCDEYVAEMWYLDHADIWSTTFAPEYLAQRRAAFDREIDIMLNDQIFRPRANIYSCRFCPYSPRGNGHCPVGV